MSKQPKALQMAKELRRADLGNAPLDHEVAEELERLHSINAEMLAALQAVLETVERNVGHRLKPADGSPVALARAAIRRATEEA